MDLTLLAKCIVVSHLPEARTKNWQVIPYPCFLISYIPYLLPSAGSMLSALCFLMAFGSSQTTEANCRSRTSSKSGLAWLWVGRVAGKLCLDGPPDLQDLGPGPGCDTRGFAALLLFLLYGGNWWGCVHWSTRLLHRAVEEPRGKKQTPYLILSSVFLCFLLTAIITTR